MAAPPYIHTSLFPRSCDVFQAHGIPRDTTLVEVGRLLGRDTMGDDVRSSGCRRVCGLSRQGTACKHVGTYASPVPLRAQNVIGSISTLQ